MMTYSIRSVEQKQWVSQKKRKKNAFMLVLVRERFSSRQKLCNNDGICWINYDPGMFAVWCCLKNKSAPQPQRNAYPVTLMRREHTEVLFRGFMFKSSCFVSTRGWRNADSWLLSASNFTLQMCLFATFACRRLKFEWQIADFLFEVSFFNVLHFLFPGLMFSRTLIGSKPNRLRRRPPLSLHFKMITADI